MEHDQASNPLKFRTICQRNGLPIGEKEFGLLQAYVCHLAEWNQRVNLISRRVGEDIWFSHILHSISPLFYVGFPPGLRVLDLGSGGGLPGIPIAIMRQDFRVVLLDSIAKKTRAVGAILGELQLTNATVVTSRAEHLARDSAHRGVYDIVMSRAVAPLADLLRWSGPLVCRGRARTASVRRPGAGRQPGEDFRLPLLLALKGGDLSRELAAARGTPVCSINLAFPGSTEIGLEEKKLVIAHLS